MSFSAVETSLQNGRPVRLYLFELASKRWAFCAADRAIAWQGDTYKPLAIDDDGIRMTGQTSADTLRIKAPVDLAPAQLFRATSPSEEVFVTIRDYHYGSADLADSAVVAWIGSISSVRWPREDTSELACNSLSASMSRPGLRLTYSRSCPHSVYDSECRVDRALHQTELTVTALNGQDFSHGQIGGALAGGFFEWTADGLTERRGIEAESGQTLTLLGGTFGLAVGMTVQAFRGCDQSSATCSGRFNNMDNYGGFRHMPGKSPFDGDPVF